MGSRIHRSTKQVGSIQRKALALTTLGLLPATTLGLTLHTSFSGHASVASQKTSEQASAPEVAATASLVTDTTKPTETESSDASVSVRINGQHIPVPSSGEIDKTIPADQGAVNVQVESSTPDDSDSSTSVRVQIQTNSSNEGSEGETETNTRARIRIKER